MQYDEKRSVPSCASDLISASLGTRDDIPRILHNGDVFLLPSLFEGLPIVLVEAQASGLQCVVSDHVTPDSDCGLCTFLPIQDAGAWADLISDILDHGTKKQADATLLQRFDANHMIDRLEDVYFKR